MIVCKHCGAALEDNTQFCRECGQKVNVDKVIGICPECGGARKWGDEFCPVCGHAFTAVDKNDTVVIPDFPEEEPVSPNNVPPKIVSDSPSPNKNLLIGGIIGGAVLLLIIICVIAGALGSDDRKDEKEITVISKEEDNGWWLLDLLGSAGKKEETSTDISEDIAEDEPEDKPEEEPEDEVEVIAEKKSLDEKIDDFIYERVRASDMGVAIIDNESGKLFQSKNSRRKFVSWGWYLPVYALYTGQSGYDRVVADGIMSRDAGVCNSNANIVISDFGGPEGITESLNYHFGTEDTVYGRYFGDVNATSDNYTTPREAVMFLQYIDNEHEYSGLSYDVSKFNIDVPYGVKVYAQAGTENINTLSELNLFAVVKGNDVDYSVAVMTRNSAGIYISELLEFINTEMEKIEND